DLDGAARESIQHELPFTDHERPSRSPLGVFPGRADRHFKDGAILLKQVIDAAVVRRLLWRDRLGAGRTDRALLAHYFLPFFAFGSAASPPFACSAPGSTTLPSFSVRPSRSASSTGISVPGDARRNAAAGSPSSTTRDRSAVSHSLRSATSMVSSPSAAWHIRRRGNPPRCPCRRRCRSRRDRRSRTRPSGLRASGDPARPEARRGAYRP